jgi:outer membrane lipoprotein-sorting protein
VARWHWRCRALSQVLVLAWACCAILANAEDGAQRGYEIAKRADDRDAGFGDSSATLTMTLYSSNGDTNTRRMRARVLETGGGDKRIIQFDEPGDVRGTAVLTFTHRDGHDDQWIYLPAIKRVKRVAGTSRSGPFMGSEFAYEDLGSQELAKFTYTHVRDEPCGKEQCFVIERRPADADSGYSRQLVWIDEGEFRPWKVEYYDRNDALLKVLTLDGYQLYKDQFWRAASMSMENVQTKKRTHIEWSNYAFGQGFGEIAFDPNRLGDAW